jgi:hypothetical protein
MLGSGNNAVVQGTIGPTKRSRDGLRIELMLYAGNNLDKALAHL